MRGAGGNSGPYRDRYNSVLGNAALRVNLKAIGRVQPRLGLGFVFPLDQNAHTDVHCGVFTSLVFEY